MTLRLATLGDVPALAGLIERSARTLCASDYTPEQIQGALAGALFLTAVTRKEAAFGHSVALVRAATVVFVGYGLLLAGVNAYKGLGFPVWLYLPALAALPLLMLSSRSGSIGKQLSDAMAAVLVTAILAVYGIDALGLDFY